VDGSDTVGAVRTHDGELAIRILRSPPSSTRLTCLTRFSIRETGRTSSHEALVDVENDLRWRSSIEAEPSNGHFPTLGQQRVVRMTACAGDIRLVPAKARVVSRIISSGTAGWVSLKRIATLSGSVLSRHCAAEGAAPDRPEQATGNSARSAGLAHDRQIVGIEDPGHQVGRKSLGQGIRTSRR
jgi:hypothetical protein